MILSDLCIRRPVFATVLSVALVIVGLATLATLPVREYPYQPQPSVTVVTQHVGASADVMENRVTRPVEDELAGMEGARRITSASRDGQSRVTVLFAPDQDLDLAAGEVGNRIGRLLPSLPEGARTPSVLKAGGGTSPVMWINVMSDRHSALALTDIVQRQLQDRLSVIDGVARLRVVGAKGHAMRVWLDPLALAARGVTAGDVARLLEAENVEHPAGRIVSQEREFSLRTHTGLRTAEDFRSLIVARGDDGSLVTLDDVADIGVEADGQRWSARADSRPAISLGVEPMADANPLEISRNVRTALDAITPSLPDGVEVDIGYEQAEFARAALRSIGFALGYSLLLVVGVIWLFLRNLRATLIPAVTIPICIIAAFAALAAFGYSVNLLILLGLIVAIGLVVDDAIVVLENIYRRVERGQPALLAATDGAREISFAVVATTAVLVAVFLPLSLLEGRVGRLFSEFGVAVSAAVVISSVVALSLIPMLCSRLFAGSTPSARLDAGRVTRLSAAYRRSLAAVIRRPLWMAALAVLVSAGAFALHAGLPDEYAPRVDRGAFRVFLQAPSGATFEYTDRYAREMESILMDPEIRDEVERVLVRIPGGPIGGATNSARATVRLSDRSERSRSASDIAGIVEARLDELPGALFWVVLPRGLGGGGDTRPVRVVLGGESYDDLALWADELVEAARTHPALTEPRSSFVARQPQFRVDVDRARAADLGVSMGSIGRTLETMLGSRKVTSYTHRDRSYPVVLQGRARDRATASDLGMIHVRSDSTDQLIPLSALVTLTETAVPGSYVRIDRRRTVTVSAGLAEGYTLGQALNAIETLAREQLPPQVHVGYDGASLRLRESGSGLRLLFVFALPAVFLVLAAQFESFRNPLVIMITVPLALSGALLGLRLAGSSLNVYSHLGLVVLIGLAAKNGVLIIEFTNQLRDAGRPFREAVLEAATIRLRPILMTSLCTIAGALPLLFAAGADAESRRPLGIVIVGGVTVATLLTLYVVPGLYVLIGRNTRSPGHVARTIRRLRGTAKDAGNAPESSYPEGTVRLANSD